MKKLALLLSAFVCLSTRADDIVVYPIGITTNNLSINPNCPGDNRWHANYLKTPSQGWGYFTNGPGFYTASITNRTDVHISYYGVNGDPGCGGPLTVITLSPANQKYRFTVWGTNNPPASTNDLPLVLHDFNP